MLGWDYVVAFIIPIRTRIDLIRIVTAALLLEPVRSRVATPLALRPLRPTEQKSWPHAPDVIILIGRSPPLPATCRILLGRARLGRLAQVLPGHGEIAILMVSISVEIVQ